MANSVDSDQTEIYYISWSKGKYKKLMATSIWKKNRLSLQGKKIYFQER